MTDKEQIEEMAKIIALDGCGDCSECNEKEKYGCYFDAYKGNAEALYDAGYRKVGEDTFVLTIEDLKKYAKDCLIGEIAGLDILQGAFAKAERVAEQVRKETAKEILQELYDEADGMNNKAVELSAYYIKNTLAKKYGIEVEH